MHAFLFFLASWQIATALSLDLLPQDAPACVLSICIFGLDLFRCVLELVVLAADSLCCKLHHPFLMSESSLFCFFVKLLCCVKKVHFNEIKYPDQPMRWGVANVFREAWQCKFAAMVWNLLFLSSGNDDHFSVAFVILLGTSPCWANKLKCLLITCRGTYFQFDWF